MRVSKALSNSPFHFSVYINIILYGNFMGGMLIDRSVRIIRKSERELKNEKTEKMGDKIIL